MDATGPAAAYSPAFLDHLTNPRRQGALLGATHRGDAEDPVCGDRLTLDLAVEGGVVVDSGFRVRGCPGAIAAGSALASLVAGRAAEDAAVTAEEVERALEGVPPAKRHALRLATETWKAALRSPIGGGSP